MTAAPSEPPTDPVRVLCVGGSDWLKAFASRRDDDGIRTPTADDPGSALERLAEANDEIDCVLSEHALGETDGIDLLRAVRDRHPDLPFVLAPAEGDASIAEEAIAAGAGYVEQSSDAARPGPLRRRIERDVGRRRTRERRRRRARRFDALFEDSETFMWVLDGDGTLRRANATAREAASPDGAPEGSPFWELPWWSGSDGLHDRVREAASTASEGEVARIEIRGLETGVARVDLDLTFHPVPDGTGAVAGVLVEGTDVTERVGLERELRASEELHRVTLNNMTDTVLVTDDDGTFTYVCPNVHFVFGYSADEVRELGTIDALLGGDLFDREELESKGVLTNVECTVTDKGGREHALLVNVRSVSIQGGTTLYSCRDVTKRKQREEALTALHRTARDLLYVETRDEIASTIVGDATDVLDLEASAVYLFDGDDTALSPIAAAGRLGANGPLPTLEASADTVAGEAFVEGESAFLDDVGRSELLANRGKGLRSGAFVPLGDHGVLVAGASDADKFEEVTTELAELVAATAEAALDRVERERELRRQERELQRRNRRLTRANRINEIIREIDQALVGAETREGIERAVCEELTADRFAFAWIGEPDRAADELRPRAWAGDEQGYLDGVDFPLAGDPSEPACRTAAGREVTLVSDVAEAFRDEPWRSEALPRGYRSAISVPLAYDDFLYGVLTVYAGERSAFDETSQAVLEELGETIASAISAVERKNALLTATSTEVEYELSDPSFPLLRLARRAECTIASEGSIQQASDGVYVFATVEGASADRLRSAAEELVSIDGARIISADGEEIVVRLRLSRPFIALRLADHGVTLRNVAVDGSTARLVVDVPSGVRVGTVDQLLTNAFEDARMAAKHRVNRSSPRAIPSQLLDSLTDRQLEVVQVAYYGGYFESPRDSTGEEIADALGISPPAFYAHVRAVQRKLFSALFEEFGVAADA